MSIEIRLNPPPGTGHTSVARLTDYWYIACASDELGRGLLARQILGVPLVLFRTRGGAISHHPASASSAPRPHAGSAR